MKIEFTLPDGIGIDPSLVRGVIKLPYGEVNGQYGIISGLDLSNGIEVYAIDGESGIHETIYNPAARGVWVIYRGKNRGGWLGKLRNAARIVSEMIIEPNQWRIKAKLERRGIWAREGD